MVVRFVVAGGASQKMAVRRLFHSTARRMVDGDFARKAKALETAALPEYLQGKKSENWGKPLPSRPDIGSADSSPLGRVMKEVSEERAQALGSVITRTEAALGAVKRQGEKIDELRREMLKKAQPNSASSLAAASAVSSAVKTYNDLRQQALKVRTEILAQREACGMVTRNEEYLKEYFPMPPQRQQNGQCMTVQKANATPELPHGFTMTVERMRSGREAKVFTSPCGERLIGKVALQRFLKNKSE